VKRSLGPLARLLLVTGVVALGLTGVAGARVVDVNTHVTIHYGQIQPKVFTKEFRGNVKSPDHACEKDRKVKVFHRDPGPDTLVGSTKSTATGHWSIGNDIAHGRHYAKVKSKAVGSRFCEPARSETIKVTQA
jgi:hypothetical protein